MRKPNMIAIAGVFVIIIALIAFLVYNGDSGKYHIDTDQTCIKVDGTTQLTMENEDDDAIDDDDKNLEWESADEDIATVDSYGLVTGVDIGKVEITGTYKKHSATIVIEVVNEDTAQVTVQPDSIIVGDNAQATFETKDESLQSNKNLKWESSDDDIATITSNGIVTGHKEGTVTIKGTYNDQIASAEITVEKERLIIPGLEPLSESEIEELPNELSVGPWNSTRKLQGVEWNTDLMDRFYVCNARRVYAYDVNGREITCSNDIGDAYMYSIDYYDGKVFSVMRSSSFGKFKLRIFDAKSLELLVSTDLVDIHREYVKDEQKYSSSLTPSIDGIMVAPAIGGGTDMKIYISYNVYYDKDEGLALNEEQTIFEYDYDSSIRNAKEIKASSRYYVNLGPIKYGIQTLEYDRSTGNIWCAVRKGLGQYSLFYLDRSTLEVIPNDDQGGWDCSHAGDGLCSLGNDYFYVLVPEYADNYTAAMIVKAKVQDLEYIG